MRKVALITGASAGLGIEFARQLSRDGHRLVLVARRKDRLDSLARELEDARAIDLDLSQPGAADRLMKNLAGSKESVDILVNNAGFGLWGKVASQDGAKLREMIDLNCGTLTELSRAVLPDMIERQSGAILNVASTAAFQPGPGMAVYFATKAFVLSFTEALHEEVKSAGIRVSALCPGPTRTEFGDVAGFAGGKMFEKMGMDAAAVVEQGLRSLEHNQAIRVTGMLNKVGAATTRFVPRPIIRKIVGSIKY